MEIWRGVRYRSRKVRFAVLSFAGIVVAAGLGASASAVPAGLTKEFQAGVDAYRLGKYDEARTHLDKAQAIDPKLPGPHRFLAAVAQAQHRWADCIAETRRALQLNPQSKEVAETRKLHADCRVADGRPAYAAELGEGAAIAVTANLTGATVRINGLRYGGTPVAPRPITPGTLELEIAKAGYKPVRLTIEAPPGIVTDVAAVLEDADPKPTPPPGTPPASRPSTPPSPAPRPRGNPRRRSRLLPDRAPGSEPGGSRWAVTGRGNLGCVAALTCHPGANFPARRAEGRDARCVI